MIFKRILVANRGEIAIRIFMACKELGITPIAVYSDADRSALHIRYADEAYYIGGSVPANSYLNIEHIIDAAKKAKVDAIHPGYGFLSENHNLAKRCEEEGIIFIGPSSDTLYLVGNKSEARKTAESLGISIIPGRDIVDIADAETAAKEIGFPVLIKASLGGGGRGMRIVRSANEMAPAVSMAKTEAEAAFGDGCLYLEKYIDDARHIEIQILADSYGAIIHLNERECSIQRRHQKLIEETPSVVVDNKLRESLADVAIALSKAVRYKNAGSVEFLLAPDGMFYFLEMNARLQVEHTITEMITGIDIVKEQLVIASGFKMRYSQKDIDINGAAIECRIYAEDPAKEFVPSPGKITYLRTSGGFGIRRDSAIYQGGEVNMFYDPLIAKLISWGKTRDEARVRMYRALREYIIRGIKTTIPFNLKVMHHPKFIIGDYNIKFVEQLRNIWGDNNCTASPIDKDIAIIASVLAHHKNRLESISISNRISFKEHGSDWKRFRRSFSV